jgi:hypothetical protein
MSMGKGSFAGRQLANFLKRSLPEADAPIKIDASEIGNSLKVIGENFFIPIGRNILRGELHGLLRRYFRVARGRLGNKFEFGYLWIPDGTTPEEFAVRIKNPAELAGVQGIEVETLIRWN